jgi:PAS domain-containing protein
MIQDISLRTIIDAIPSAIFIVNQNLSIIAFNHAASRIYKRDSNIILKRLCGEILHCLHERKSKEACGMTKFCPDCVIKKAVEEAIRGKTVFKQKYKMKIQEGAQDKTAYLLISTSPLEFDGQTYAVLVIDDITEITELKNLLPICAKCKKIRKDEKFWENLESYFHKHTDITFSHSICPDCSKKLYSSLDSTQKG